MDLDIVITALKRRSDRNVLFVGDELTNGGIFRGERFKIAGFELCEKGDKIGIVVLTKYYGSDRIFKIRLKNCKVH